MVFIKITNPAIRDELSAAGFSYITERINQDTELFAFADCKQIRKLLAEKYADEKYFVSDRLCF